MDDVAVERGEVLVAIHVSEQIGPHRDQVAGSPRRAVEAADQLLPPRLGCEMQIAAVAVARVRLPGLDRVRKLLPIRSEVARQRLEEAAPAGLVEIVIAVEYLARHRGARGFAAARQQRLAQFDQAGSTLPAVGRVAAAKKAAAALGDRRKQVGKEGIGHGA